MEDKKELEKFKVTRKSEYREEKSINMTLRLDKALQQKYDEWAFKTNRSRNELMCMALAYAIENIVFIDEEID